MRTILSKEGYLLKKDKFKKIELENIRKDLTVQPFNSFNGVKKDPIQYKVYQEDDNYISIPKFYGLEKFGKPDIDNETNGIVIDIKFNGKPRPIQEPIIDTTIHHIDTTGGGLICAGCGVGKTIMALYIACHYKVKTLIIVHKTFLMNQWIERIKEFTNCNKIGIIKQDKCEVVDNDIVIGMVQSIAKDKYDDVVFKDFGLVIFDEAHRAPSEYFSKALPIIACKKSLALSATPKRADKMEKILYWYFGTIAYKAPPNKNDKVMVNLYNYNLTSSKFKESRISYSGEVNRPRTINNIVKLKKRNKFIINIIEELMAEEGRQILILSDRIEHLDILKETIDNKLGFSCEYYVGGMSQKKLDESSKASIILGSYGMASEGLDIPSLNTLIMATPRREVEQSVGRIIRKVGAIQPIIVDIVDMLPSLERQGIHRRKLYKKLDYQVKIFDVEDNNITTIYDMNECKNIHMVNNTFEETLCDEIDFID